MNVIVTAPLVVVPDAAGNLRYFYRGAVIDELSEHDYDRLTDSGMIADAGPVVVEAAEPVVDPGEPGPVGQPDAGELERPKQAAPKEAWVEYAVARGMSEAEADALTKAELIARLA